MGKNGYFALGGIGAFGLYAFFVFLIAISLMDFHKKRTQSLKSEQSAIEVNIEDMTPKAEEQAQMLEPTEPQITQPIKETKLEPKKQVEAIDPLKVMKTAIKQETKSQPKQTQQPTKSATQTQKQPTSAMDLLKGTTIKENSTARSGIENEYLKKIQQIIEKKWNFTQSDHGKRALIELSINKDGSFTFKLLETNNKEFSNRGIECLKSLQKQGFPPPPNSKAILGESVNFEGYKNSI
jgi:periplasmic protein TonB